MSDETLSLIMRARDEMSGAVNRAAGNLDKLGKSGSVVNQVLSGIGSGIGIAGVLGVANAVSTLTNVMEGAVRGAMEDERSQVALGVVLRDNVAAWAGNTDAIEAAIAKRMRLGFADDQLRGSLGSLVAVTHDVDKAMNLQALAMDLARFRGIDLASATDAVAKAAGGSLKALNAMVPATRGASSATEALGIAIRATAGQADAYAETALGKMEAAQIRVGESTERLGSRILPALADAMDLAAGAVDLVTTAIDGLTLPMQSVTQASWDAADSVYQVGYQAGWATAQVNGYAAAAAAAARPTVGLGTAAFEAADKANFLADRAWVSANAMANQRSAALKAAEAIDILRDAEAGEEVTARIAATGAWTATTAFYAQAGGLDRAGMGVSNLDERMKQLVPTVTGTAARSTEAFDRMIERLRALDAAQQVVFDRMIRNLTRVIDTQLAALDAAQAQREADRQAIADKRDLAEALRALGDAQAAVAANPQDAGAQQALLAAQQRVQDVRDRMAETALRSQEAKLRASLEATKTYIEAVAELERNATNRKALANTLAAREKSLLESRAKAEAAGDTQGVAEIDMKLAAIRAAMVRNEEAMKIAKATTAIQVYTTVHTKITVDGKTLADIVDKYLGSKPT